MKSLTQRRRWRLLALLVSTAALAVIIPTAFGASAAGVKSKPQLQHQSRLVINPSFVRHGQAMKMSTSSTCSGGSIAPGTYTSLVISGVCTLDAGSVVVRHTLTVQPNAALLAAFGGGPTLTVGGNLYVRTNGVLVLGCEPEAFVCLNDPDQTVGTLSSKEIVFGSLEAHNALAVLVHGDVIGHDLLVDGGGGGVNCDPQDALFGSPAYGTFEDSSIGGGVTVKQWHSCWLGFFRNSVGRNVDWHNNVTADPDGNEIATDTVRGNFSCRSDNPAAQFGDSGGAPSVVLGRALGECAAISG